MTTTLAFHEASLAEELANIDGLRKKYNTLTVMRLISVAALAFAIYLLIRDTADYQFVMAFILLVIFLYLVKSHQKTKQKKEFHETIADLHQEEIDFLKLGKRRTENGHRYDPEIHSYASDLDLFGENSLYQHLCRAETYLGKQKLATRISAPLPEEGILKNQEAVSDLASKRDWRIRVQALARLSKDWPNFSIELGSWVKDESTLLPKWLRLYLPVAGILYLSLSISAVFFPEIVQGKYLLLLFFFHLFLFGSQFKKIKLALLQSDKVYATLMQLSFIFKEIEGLINESELLKNYQDRCAGKQNASASIKQLSDLYSRLDSMYNAFGATLFNGLFLYHLIQFNKLHKWKKDAAAHIDDWLQVLGEIEALSSLANFSANNPGFVFPKMQRNQSISFENLGHPLIAANSRVNNSLHFRDFRLIILTGSNMSGKSTFLRTLGVNWVLAGAGAPVCATQANYHPIPILASMRLKDSLSESQSYFFAEVQRLHDIMEALDSAPALVLLDEILRGTNSDDKRSGTIGVIRKLVEKNALGIIATHDLEVCATRDEYPDVLSNQHFEVEIDEGGLQFDYKLREGICRNKSASYLMKEKKIID